MRARLFPWAAAAVLAAASARAGEPPLGPEELVRRAVAANPQVAAARAQAEAAERQIGPAYVPQDPQVSWTAADSVGGVAHPAVRTIGVSESLQFPGKAWLQGDEAHRNAEIARLAFAAAVRDVKAQTETAYYQTLLDAALAETAQDNASNLERVLKVAQVAYAANQVPQSDLISAEFDLAQASQAVRAGLEAEANDEAALNLALGADPRSPLTLVRELSLEPLDVPLDPLIERARASRQEILEAALTEKNSRTALKLAWMGLLPDLSLSYSRNQYVLDSASPNPGVDARDNTLTVGFNVPVFFWFRQKEDIRSARRLLDAARENRRLVELQAETAVAQLYRSTRLAYDSALLYRNSLIPLARQNFQVALIAYQARKVDFTSLSAALQRINQARIGYLTAANQFLAGRAALEQALGAPLAP